jgi:hypothetical protein
MSDRIKLCFNQEVKKMARPPTFQCLQEQAQKAFSQEIGMTFKFHYIDLSEDDHDEITISNDDDLEEAYSF